eukprot:98142-Pyramimonas_sp.AAC.1
MPAKSHRRKKVLLSRPSNQLSALIARLTTAKVRRWPRGPRRSRWRRPPSPSATKGVGKSRREPRPCGRAAD